MSNGEIKFRAWDLEYQMMCYPKAHYVQEGSVATEKQKAETWKRQPLTDVYNTEENESHSIFYNDERFIPLQYTGLKDKNGKEIYEGDIVRVKRNIDFIAVIKWRAGRGRFVWSDPTSDEPSSAGGLWSSDGRIGISDTQDVAIIGNIYENPELLEGK